MTIRTMPAIFMRHRNGSPGGSDGTRIVAAVGGVGGGRGVVADWHLPPCKIPVDGRAARSPAGGIVHPSDAAAARRRVLARAPGVADRASLDGVVVGAAADRAALDRHIAPGRRGGAGVLDVPQ